MVAAEAMLDVCHRFAAEAPADVVFPQPYIPMIPQDWNGLLALAEAQNLGDPHRDYVRQLEAATSEERMQRLKPGYPVGIEPWDDGSMKLMLKSMIPTLNLARVAVSNAVPWSARAGGRTNVNPREEAEAKAVEFWREILCVLSADLRLVVAFGNVAARVLAGAGWAGSCVKLRLPSPPGRHRIAGMFDDADLLERFPEVKQACEAVAAKDPSFERPKTGQVLFACHAASRRGDLPPRSF